MNKKLISIGFVTLLFSVSLINIIKPQREFSENENRYLQKLPKSGISKIFSGKFSMDFEEYAADQFIGRDGWITLKTLAELAILKKDNGRIYFGKDGTLFDATETVDSDVLEDNAVYVKNFINKLRSKTPELDASILLVPTATEIYNEKLPRFAPVPDQQSAINRVSKIFDNDAILLDTIDLLKSNKGKYLYYRTDHHWTTDAAYIVYCEWARKVGLTPLSLNAFSVKNVSTAFYGTLYSKANLVTLKPDTVKAYHFNDAVSVSADLGSGKTSNTLYFDEYLNKKDKYSYFLGSNRPLIEIETGTKNGYNLLLIQDSYAHCFVPFLTQHFEKISVVDLRYLTIDLYEYAIKNDITDVLVLYNLPGFATEKTISRLEWEN
ncbi:MAG: DHHW family protein [Oscillospiraceae bacterium]|nr:DHHW family protein [Oscillospiraceae bacterium]